MIAGMAVLIAGSTAFGADEPARFAGEWKTTAGPVVLEQKGDEVTGKIEGIIYDHFGDFVGFTLRIETGHEHGFRAQEPKVEELLSYA